ncbi:MAG TPA: hypothetical protein VEL51_05570 [Vicinamibacterales bacterium]|nr:hypothetical protein [Vicinamibacterales bacterium]
MTVDRYTKGVLTVIAGALLYIAAMMSGPAASAQGTSPFGVKQLSDTKPQPVVIVGWGTLGQDGEIRLTMAKERNGAIRTDPTMPVKVREMPESPVDVSLGVTTQHPLPVGLTSINAGADWEPIRTKVEPAPTQRTPGGPGGQ